MSFNCVTTVVTTPSNVAYLNHHRPVGDFVYRDLQMALHAAWINMCTNTSKSWFARILLFRCVVLCVRLSPAARPPSPVWAHMGRCNITEWAYLDLMGSIWAPLVHCRYKIAGTTSWGPAVFISRCCRLVFNLS